MTYSAVVYPDQLPSGAKLVGANCTNFDIAGQGKTEDEALDDLRGAVSLFLDVPLSDVEFSVTCERLEFAA